MLDEISQLAKALAVDWYDTDIQFTEDVEGIRQGNIKGLSCRMAEAIRAAVAEAVAAERELLEYVYSQTMGDRLKSTIKDDKMIKTYLSAGALRRIAAIIIRARGEEEQ